VRRVLYNADLPIKIQHQSGLKLLFKRVPGCFVVDSGICPDQSAVL